MPGFLFAWAKRVVAVARLPLRGARRGRAWHGSTNAAAAVTRCGVIRTPITQSSSGEFKLPQARTERRKKKKAPEVN
ncbi:hypothetical protein LGM69_31015 [Burkholderia multivorans]|nr:hypothetical protein [Burkholderia multivorans]